jgi:hypothetical protein
MRVRWDAAENSDESKRDFTCITAGSQFHSAPSSNSQER